MDLMHMTRQLQKARNAVSPQTERQYIDYIQICHSCVFNNIFKNVFCIDHDALVYNDGF
jgi:hypothetical protein